MYRHCVSAVSPSGTTLPSDAEIPHVAGVTDDEDAGLPPGERCYSCDVGEDGIPLERRVADQHGHRHRRHADYKHPLPVDNHVIIII